MPLRALRMFRKNWPVLRVAENMREDMDPHAMSPLDKDVAVHVILVPMDKTPEFTAIVAQFMDTLRDFYDR